jgi:hypothetical protein
MYDYCKRRQDDKMVNDRIYELAKQVGLIEFETIHDSMAVTPNIESVVKAKRFAELIVRECLNMCADSDAALQRIKDRETSPDSEYVRYGAADYEWAAAYGKQIDHYESIADKSTNAGDKIREHFGVE